MRLHSCVIFFGIFVLLLDLSAALLSVKYHLLYSNFLIGSLLIYTMSGFFVEQSKWLWKSVLTGSAIGLIESTFGWMISWQIVPEQVGSLNNATVQLKETVIIFTIIVVTLTGLVFGLVGGVLRKIQIRLNT